MPKRLVVVGNVQVLEYVGLMRELKVDGERITLEQLGIDPGRKTSIIYQGLDDVAGVVFNPEEVTDDQIRRVFPGVRRWGTHPPTGTQ